MLFFKDKDEFGYVSFKDVKVSDVRNFLETSKEAAKRFGPSALQSPEHIATAGEFLEIAKNLTTEIEKIKLDASMPDEFNKWKSEVNQLSLMAKEAPPYDLRESKSDDTQAPRKN